MRPPHLQVAEEGRRGEARAAEEGHRLMEVVMDHVVWRAEAPRRLEEASTVSEEQTSWALLYKR